MSNSNHYYNKGQKPQAENSFDKIKHPFMIKITDKLGVLSMRCEGFVTKGLGFSIPYLEDSNFQRRNTVNSQFYL